MAQVGRLRPDGFHLLSLAPTVALPLLLQSPYDVLGVPTTATQDEIRQAYKKQALRWHPDKQHSKSPTEVAEAQEQFRRVNEAYVYLTDPSKSQRYAGPDSTSSGAGGQPGNSSSSSYSSSFSSMFGSNSRMSMAEAQEIFAREMLNMVIAQNQLRADSPWAFIKTSASILIQAGGFYYGRSVGSLVAGAVNLLLFNPRGFGDVWSNMDPEQQKQFAAAVSSLAADAVQHSMQRQ